MKRPGASKIQATVEPVRITPWMNFLSSLNLKTPSLCPNWISSAQAFFSIHVVEVEACRLQVADTNERGQHRRAFISSIQQNSFPMATVITLLPEVEIENRHIMAVSGLRNDQSLRNYNSGPSHFQQSLDNSPAAVQTRTNHVLQQHHHQHISMGFGGDKLAKYSGLFGSRTNQRLSEFLSASKLTLVLDDAIRPSIFPFMKSLNSVCFVDWTPFWRKSFLERV